MSAFAQGLATILLCLMDRGVMLRPSDDGRQPQGKSLGGEGRRSEGYEGQCEKRSFHGGSLVEGYELKRLRPECPVHHFARNQLGVLAGLARLLHAEANENITGEADGASQFPGKFNLHLGNIFIDEIFYLLLRQLRSVHSTPIGDGITA